MRILILLVSLLFAAPSFAQVAGTPCNRWEAVVENAAGGELSATKRGNLARAQVRADGQNPAAMTNAEICNTALARVHRDLRTTRGNEARSDQAPITEAAVNAAEADANPD